MACGLKDIAKDVVYWFIIVAQQIIYKHDNSDQVVESNPDGFNYSSKFKLVKLVEM